MYNHVTGDQFLSEITNQMMLSVLVIYLFILYFFFALFVFKIWIHMRFLRILHFTWKSLSMCGISKFQIFKNIFFKFIFWGLTCFIFVQQNGTKGV